MAQDEQSQHHAPAKTNAAASARPLLAALFLIKFDVKVGYTIDWKRSIPHVPLEGFVEYKSLPSGLHNVKEDLVYFTHQDYSGVSAFVHGSASDSERNAKFVAVGALLPSHDGRLGRAWDHAGRLTDLARQMIQDLSNVQILEEYWDGNKLPRTDLDISTTPQLSPFSLAQSRLKGESSTNLVKAVEHMLTGEHPALSIVDFVETFGPLVYPLLRAALLRKRILILTEAPVRKACEFVYDLSVCSSIPGSLAQSLLLPSANLWRLRPLFSVGVHDISTLEPKQEVDVASDAWIACSTDGILAVKNNLYDLLVELPGHGSTNRRPNIKWAADQSQMKATQRDLRRWVLLRHLIHQASHAGSVNHEAVENWSGEDEPLLADSSSTLYHVGSVEAATNDESKVMEKISLSELAYSSFLWWASAGEKDDFLVEEDEHDRAAFSDVFEAVEHILDQPRASASLSIDENATEGSRDARLEVALISYFHGLTKTLFKVSNDLFDAGETEEPGEPAKRTRIGREDMQELGLDAWSKHDKAFIEDFARLWFDKDVKADKVGIECCGVQIC